MLAWGCRRSNPGGVWPLSPPPLLFRAGGVRTNIIQLRKQNAKKNFWPNLRSNRQLEPPLLLHFSHRIFRHSALLIAPNISIDPIFRKGDMGSLVHSLECGEATAVSVTSVHPDLVSNLKLWFLALEFGVSCTTVWEWFRFRRKKCQIKMSGGR